MLVWFDSTAAVTLRKFFIHCYMKIGNFPGNNSLLKMRCRISKSNFFKNLILKFMKNLVYRKICFL